MFDMKLWCNSIHQTNKLESSMSVLIFPKISARKEVNILNVQYGRREWRDILFKSDS